MMQPHEINTQQPASRNQSATSTAMSSSWSLPFAGSLMLQVLHGRPYPDNDKPCERLQGSNVAASLRLKRRCQSTREQGPEGQLAFRRPGLQSFRAARTGFKRTM